MRREREVGEGKMSRRGRREAAGQSGDHQWEGAHGQGRCRCEGRSVKKSDPKVDPDLFKNPIQNLIQNPVGGSPLGYRRYIWKYTLQKSRLCETNCNGSDFVSNSVGKSPPRGKMLLGKRTA